LQSALFKFSYYSGDQIKEDDMGALCGAYGREEMCVQGFSGET